MSQSLAKDFNFRSLLKFAFPSIIMMIFMSLYSIVDGFFIAQYVDSMALSAANIVYPAVSILLAVGIMFGTGGSAVVKFNKVFYKAKNLPASHPFQTGKQTDFFLYSATIFCSQTPFLTRTNPITHLIRSTDITIK